jgi:hypothetical protein
MSCAPKHIFPLGRQVAIHATALSRRKTPRSVCRLSPSTPPSLQTSLQAVTTFYWVFLRRSQATPSTEAASMLRRHTRGLGPGRLEGIWCVQSVHPLQTTGRPARDHSPRCRRMRWIGIKPLWSTCSASVVASSRVPADLLI